MTKTSGSSEQSITAEARGTKKVWRFIDYQLRWGNGCEGLPKYIKWYINGWEGCEGEVVSALNQLRAERDFVWLQGALVELLTRATNTDERFQGYLLSSRHDPASASQIGRILRFKGRGSHKRADAVLQKLSRAGFLEQVSIPNFDSGREKREGGNRQSINVTTPPKGGRSREKRHSRGQNAEKPLKGKGKAAAQQRKYLEGETERQERIQTLKAQCQAMQGQETTLPPATAPPRSPTNPDVPGRVRSCSGHTPALASIANVIKLNEHRYDADAWEFADQVLLRSRYLTPYAIEAARAGRGYEPDVECERAHWAKAWHDAKGTFGGERLTWLRDQMFRRVDRIGGQRQSKHNPESYLMTTWNNLVKDAARKLKGNAG